MGAVSRPVHLGTCFSGRNARRVWGNTLPTEPPGSPRLLWCLLLCRTLKQFFVLSPCLDASTQWTWRSPDHQEDWVQLTKHVELPQTRSMDIVVDMLVVILRQVPTVQLSKALEVLRV